MHLAYHRAFMLGSQAVRYRHEIMAFQKFKIETNIVAADESWIWIRHTFISNERIAAHVLARVIIKQGRKTVNPKEMFSLVGLDAATIPKPEAIKEVQEFLAWDADVKEQMTSSSSPGSGSP